MRATAGPRGLGEYLLFFENHRAVHSAHSTATAKTKAALSQCCHSRKANSREVIKIHLQLPPRAYLPLNANGLSKSMPIEAKAETTTTGDGRI